MDWGKHLLRSLVKIVSGSQDKTLHTWDAIGISTVTAARIPYVQGTIPRAKDDSAMNI